MPEPPDRIHRLVYLGTPAIAVPPLEALHRAGFDIATVVTRADKRRGRGGQLQPSPVKAAATTLGLPVSHDIDTVLEARADLGVVVAYGRIIQPHVLEALALVNLHFSLLPRWRGAAPVERAILAGDQVTGVCLMRVEAELDSGPVYRRAEVPIGADQTRAELSASLVEVGTDLLVSALREGLGEPVPQVGEVTYAAKLEPDELELDWSRPAVELHRVIRLGGAWTTIGGKRLKIWRADVVDGAGRGTGRLEPGELDGCEVGTGEGRLALVEVQLEGKPPRPAAEWLRGARVGGSTRLGG